MLRDKLTDSCTQANDLKCSQRPSFRPRLLTSLRIRCIAVVTKSLAVVLGREWSVWSIKKSKINTKCDLDLKYSVGGIMESLNEKMKKSQLPKLELSTFKGDFFGIPAMVGIVWKTNRRKHDWLRDCIILCSILLEKQMCWFLDICLTHPKLDTKQQRENLSKSTVIRTWWYARI